jgi:hypothetical protein
MTAQTPSTQISGTKRTHDDQLKSTFPYEPIVARNKCDTHANTCCAGSNWEVIELSGIKCNVSGFSSDLGSHKRIPVATVGSLWVNPADGQHYILVLNEALYFGNQLDHSLINPNHIRSYLGDVGQDNPFDSRPMGIRIKSHDVEIPFVASGATIYYESTRPLTEELEKFTHIVLTSDKPWSPSAIRLTTDTDNDNRVISGINSSRHDHDEYESDYVLEGNFGMTEQIFYRRIISRVYTIPDELKKKYNLPVTTSRRMEAMMRSNDRHSKNTPEHIAKVFDITIDKAKETLSKTTQMTIRQGVNPITRRYKSFNLDPNQLRISGEWTIDFLEA